MQLRSTDIDRVFMIERRHLDLDALIEGAGDVFSDIVCADRQLPMPAVDQYGQLDLPCPAKAGDRIHGRPDRASLEKDIIHQDDLFVLYRNGRCRTAHIRCSL